MYIYIYRRYHYLHWPMVSPTVHSRCRSENPPLTPPPPNLPVSYKRAGLGQNLCPQQACTVTACCDMFMKSISVSQSDYLLFNSLIQVRELLSDFNKLLCCFSYDTCMT